MEATLVDFFLRKLWKCWHCGARHSTLYGRCEWDNIPRVMKSA